MTLAARYCTTDQKFKVPIVVGFPSQLGLQWNARHGKHSNCFINRRGHWLQLLSNNTLSEPAVSLQTPVLQDLLYTSPLMLPFEELSYIIQHASTPQWIAAGYDPCFMTQTMP